MIEVPSLYHCRFYTPVLAFINVEISGNIYAFSVMRFFSVSSSVPVSDLGASQRLGRGDINAGINAVTTAFNCHTIPTTNLRPSTRVLKHHPSPLLARSSKRESCIKFSKM